MKFFPGTRILFGIKSELMPLRWVLPFYGTV